MGSCLDWKQSRKERISEPKKMSIEASQIKMQGGGEN